MENPKKGVSGAGGSGAPGKKQSRISGHPSSLIPHPLPLTPLLLSVTPVVANHAKHG